MRKLLFILSFSAIVTLPVFSQSNVTPDSRLSAVYSADYLNNLSVNNQKELQYLNWYLDNSYRIVEAGADKCSAMPYLEMIDPATKIITGNAESVDEGNFNILLYSFERQYDKKTYYRIGDTGYAIVFESYKKLAENFNIYQDEN